MFDLTLTLSRLAVLLTCYHLTFATIVTQIIGYTTTLLENRKAIRMTARLYLCAIFPIGILYSLSLVCSNLPYLYLSVAFIQMLKVGRLPAKRPHTSNSQTLKDC